MLRYMLDTNTCIFTIKNKPFIVRRHFSEHEGELCISSVSLMELYFGAEKSERTKANMTQVEGFAARLEVLEYDPAAASHTAQIRAELQSIGKPIGPYDAMIAGHARSQGLVVVTNNVREFSSVPGLRLEDWAASA